MKSWENDPAYRAVERAFVDGDPLEQVGGPLDVRAVMAGIPTEAKDGFLIEKVPWDLFPEGVRVRESMERLGSGDAVAVDSALDVLGGLCANDMRAAVAPAAPFLLRIAADSQACHRADALAVVSAAARWGHHGVCTRADMLRFRYSGDEWGFEVTGYPGNWSVQAARDAIAADADLLRPLLDDPESEIRIATAYVLAAASGRERDISNALHASLIAEHEPTVRGGLVLAIAQLARAHEVADAEEWTRACWSDLTRPSEVRFSAALGWMCLTDTPIPDDLHAMLNSPATEEAACLMARLPWMRAVENSDGDGLYRCLRKMLHPDEPDPEDLWDPWS
ncbi:hypothetical protein ACFRQM_25750 [Streptomyces sp. NPDC056831]|uniref:hypothetical protein n=1 Tax=Streptomyces sp. NPDC056831 TaxID=3345954 RepID=UPI0036C9A398